MRSLGASAISRRGRSRRVISALLALVLVFSVVPVVFAEDVTEPADYGSGKYTADLLAGAKQLDVGEVEVFNDQNSLYIDILPDGWEIKKVQIYVGFDAIPVHSKTGQPLFQDFPYQTLYKELAAEHHEELKLKVDLDIPWGRPFEARRTQNIAVRVEIVNKTTKISESAWMGAPRWFVETKAASTPKSNGLPVSNNHGMWMRYYIEKPTRGHFVDSPVGGLQYKTKTFNVATDATGSFLYFPGESVEFALAGYPIGSSATKFRVTPLDLFGTADIGDPRVGNLARLLQSLDADGNPRDRIFIPQSVQDALAATIVEYADAENDGDFAGYDFTDYEMIEFLIEGTIAKMEGVEGVTLTKVSTEEALANLAKTLESTNVKFQKNISKTEDLYTTKSRIMPADFYVPARVSNGESTVIEYYDEYGDLIETRDEAQPIVVAYLDEHPDVAGSLDVWAAVSLDDGSTWKRRNISRTADISSFTLANGEEYPGTCEKPSLHVKDNKILIVWTSKYAKGGRPRYSIETSATDPTDTYPYDDPYYTEDIWGVGGPQRSTDYTELGFEEVGELPYNAVWTQRGVIDKDTGDVTWYKPERLTSARRNAMQLVEAAAGNLAGFAIAWQEDPEGIRPGQGKGSGVGWSGAIASHGTDIWYSYISMEDFDDVDTNWVSPGESKHDEDSDIVGRLKVLVPFSLPVRLTDNETINTDNIKVELDEDGYPVGNDDPTTWTPLLDEDGKEIGTHSYAYKLNKIADWYETVNKKGVPKKVAITADGRLLDGDTASTRPALFLQGYKKSDGTLSAWAIVGYEESKGLGGGMPNAHSDTDDPDFEEGDYVESDCDDVLETEFCSDCHGIVHEGKYDEEQCYSCHGIVHEDQVSEDPEHDGSGSGRYKPDIGKNIVYHSFDWKEPETVSGGTILNLQATDPDTLEPAWVLNEDGSQMLDWQGEAIPAYENARRPRFLVQGKELALKKNTITKPNGTVMVMVYKQGEAGRGGPSDIYIRRWEIPNTAKGNPYSTEYIVPGATNVSAVTPTEFWENPDQLDDPDKGIKLVRWTQDESNLADYSWEYANDNAQAQRGYLRGDLLVLGYTWTPNWKSARNGNDVYNLYIRRSFDGGATFTTTPASDPYGVYEYNGQGATWSEVFRNPQEGTTEVVEEFIAAGDFEPARNITTLTNNKVNIIEPRIVPPGSPIADSGHPEDEQDFSAMWLTWGTGEVNAISHGEDGDEEEDVGKVPLDLQYTYSLNWGDTWVLEEKTVPTDSLGNHAGETVFRPFYLAKGDSSQGEVQVKLSADASKAYMVWNDEGPKGVGEMDVHFRRIMPYAFDHNRSEAPAITQLIP